MQRTQIVYLVGPISGCSYGGCTEWRAGVKADLEKTGLYHCLTPMRGKQHLQDQTDLPAVIPGHITRPGCSNHDILRRDFYDCQRADVVFCNLLGSTTVSIGSMWELAWSFANPNSFSVVILEPENIHAHAFLREGAGVIFPTLEEGVAYMEGVLNS